MKMKVHEVIDLLEQNGWIYYGNETTTDWHHRML